VQSVTAPDKRTWKVGRRWLPKKLRLPRRRDFDATDGIFALDFVEGVSTLVVGIVIFVTLALALVLVWPILALAIELIAIVLIALVGLIGRVLFRRPWRIVATPDDAPADQLMWDVPGWRASSEAIEEIATALKSGREPRVASGKALTPGKRTTV
jgi:hypothetical protein